METKNLRILAIFVSFGNDRRVRRVLLAGINHWTCDDDGSAATELRLRLAVALVPASLRFLPFALGGVDLVVLMTVAGADVDGSATFAFDSSDSGRTSVGIFSLDTNTTSLSESEFNSSTYSGVRRCGGFLAHTNKHSSLSLSAFSHLILPMV